MAGVVGLARESTGGFGNGLIISDSSSAGATSLGSSVAVASVTRSVAVNYSGGHGAGWVTSSSRRQR